MCIHTYIHIHIHMYVLCTEATGDNMFHMCFFFSKRNGLWVSVSGIVLTLLKFTQSPLSAGSPYTYIYIYIHTYVVLVYLIITYITYNHIVYSTIVIQQQRGVG